MPSNNRGRIGMLAVGSLALVGLSIPAASAGEPSPTSQVTGHDDWYTQAYENTPDGSYTDPQQADVTGPQRAPFGPGSHQMTLGQYAVQTELYRTDKYDDVPLSQIDRLEYSTFAKPTSGTADRQPTYLRLSLDEDGDKKIDHSLFYYPGNNGPVVNGQWQHWDVTGGLMNVDGDSGQGEISLADYAAQHPTAKLVNDKYDPAHDAGALALITGGGGETQTNGTYFVDRVIVGQSGNDTLFDFGPSAEGAGSTDQTTVDPAHDRGWKHQAYNNDTYLNSDQEFVQGPDTPPAGAGSLKFTLSDDTDADRVELFRTAKYDGTLLRDVRTLDFSTYQRAASGNATPQQPVYARLSLDDDGNGSTDHTLYYYPANNGAVAQSTWQSWHAAADDAKWSVGADAGPGSTVTLDQYLVANPDATIVKNADPAAPEQPQGGVAFLVGGAGNATQMNGEYFLDDLKIGMVDAATGQTRSTDGFDLEPTQPRASVGDASVLEGNHGATLRFPVTLSGPASKDVSVTYTTHDGTAKAGRDYKATTGTVTIPAGETSGIARVKVVSDKVREGDETLTVTLGSPGYGTLADRRAVGTIVNDDTRVGLVLRQADGHRIRAKVDTLPAAPHATVKIFRMVDGRAQLLLKDELNRLGRLNTVLQKHYRPGTTVKLVSKVTTEYGVYRSKAVRFTVR